MPRTNTLAERLDNAPFGSCRGLFALFVVTAGAKTLQGETQMWKLRDIVLAVIFSVVCGAVYMGWDWLSTLTTSLAPWVQGLMNGVWWIASILVAYIVRRPGAALLAGFASAVFEWAFGSPWG
ncbi:hypothetical protein GCM10025857_10070 [Alicyclobacillus contaminans]|nr:hypothetical protein GCM10025857_10070 [Alicyclobacillus contaminans]